MTNPEKLSISSMNINSSSREGSAIANNNSSQETQTTASFLEHISDLTKKFHERRQLYNLYDERSRLRQQLKNTIAGKN
ncbi:hypothetical protein IJJ27_01105 [bacterium]|nr:hypothetical protein [bacterium]